MCGITDSWIISYVHKACEVVCILSLKLFILTQSFSSNNCFTGYTILFFFKLNSLLLSVAAQHGGWGGGGGGGSSAVEELLC